MRRDAAGFALEVSGAEGLAAWAKLEKGRGQIALGRIDLERLALKGAPRALTTAAGDADSPKLVRRAEGYFLGYVLHEPSGGEGTKAPRPRSDDSDAGSGESLLEEGPSAIYVVPLDASGNPTAGARRITPPRSHVITFELLPTPDSGALVLYRDDPDGPGLDRPSVEVVSVRPDGSSVSRTWELGESAGLPSLLADPAPPAGGPWGFLAVALESETRVMPLAAEPLELGEFWHDPLLSGAELMAVGGGHWLRARVHGESRELDVIGCRFVR
jgi:hypothetical protein